MKGDEASGETAREWQVRGDRIRMALAEVGQSDMLLRVSPPTDRWEGQKIIVSWDPRAPLDLRWKAHEVAAFGARSPRCLACYIERFEAWNAGREMPSECEASGRWLLRDCGRPRHSGRTARDQ